MQWISMLWRARKAVCSINGGCRRKGGSKQHLKFQYDPSSYALNFDDGCPPLDLEEEQTITIAHGGAIGSHLVHIHPQVYSTNPTTTWIYVSWAISVEESFLQWALRAMDLGLTHVQIIEADCLPLVTELKQGYLSWGP